jgi:hypothetical protein
MQKDGVVVMNNSRLHSRIFLNSPQHNQATESSTGTSLTELPEENFMGVTKDRFITS